MKCFKSWRGFLFRYFVEFELFVMFPFVPTTKPANDSVDSRCTFLGVLASMSLLNASVSSSVCYYTGSLWLTSFCILFVAVCMFVLAKVNGFYVSPKTQNFSSKFGSTHSCSISAKVLFRKRP